MIKVQRRHNSAEVANVLRRRAAAPPETKAAPRFSVDLWIRFTIQNWLLDVGRPVTMLVLPSYWFPLNRPSAADLLHALYTVATPLLLLKMLEHSPRTLPHPSVHLGVITVVMGTTLHLVAESVSRRLYVIGCQLHHSVREKPDLKHVHPPAMVDIIEFLLYVDDGVARLMWCVPVFLAHFFFFSGCFVYKKPEVQMPPAAWALLVPNAAYYWYLITEGQTFILFIFTFFTMGATMMHQQKRGLVPDGNGTFMFSRCAPAVFASFCAALLLLSLWVFWLWDDDVLRKKHPGLIYVPQPLTFFMLHLQQLPPTNSSGGSLR